MAYAGVDGCRKGWIMINFAEGEYSFGVYKEFRELAAENQDVDRILVDMPIGLSSADNPRTIDRLLREKLDARKSTVFNPPCREAVYAEDSESARKKNIATEGKSLSIQSLSLRDKIRQIDEYLQYPGKSKIELIESHPEFCFKQLNSGITVLSKKSKPAGIKERLGILEQYESRAWEIYRGIIGSTKRKDVKPDDINDALCLCVTNKLAGRSGLSYLTDNNLYDSRGIMMRIGYWRKEN